MKSLTTDASRSSAFKEPVQSTVMMPLAKRRGEVARRRRLARTDESQRGELSLVPELRTKTARWGCPGRSVRSRAFATGPRDVIYPTNHKRLQPGRDLASEETRHLLES